MNIFSSDGWFPRFFGTLGDIIIVNILFILCSIPIVTMGASMSAMYFTLLKKQRTGENGGVVKLFFKGFKDNFKQSTISWLGLYTLPAYVLLSSTQVFMVGIFVFIVCGFGLIAYVSSFMFLKAFTPYLDEVTKKYTDDDPASWMHSDDQTSESDEDNPESTKVTKKLIVDNSYHGRQ